MTIKKLFTKYQSRASLSAFKSVLKTTRNWTKSSEYKEHKASNRGYLNADIVYIIISLRASLNKNNK